MAGTDATRDRDDDEWDVFVYERATGMVTLVSHTLAAPGATGNGVSRDPTISADGAVVAFHSRASNLVAGTDAHRAHTYNDWDVFLYERVSGTVTLVSHVPGVPGTTGNRLSSSPVVSANGGFVTFLSLASNLVAGRKANFQYEGDVFLYERATGTVTLVSHVPGEPGTTGNAGSWDPVISADGAVVAFYSYATDLVAGMVGDVKHHVFLFERATGTVSLVSHVPGSPQTPGNASSHSPAISADGAFVAFGGWATDLVAEMVERTDVNDQNVFLYERATRTMRLVSHALGAPGTGGNGVSVDPVITADGGVVAFRSNATGLVAGGVGGDQNYLSVFAYERATDTVALVSHPPGAFATVGNRGSDRPGLNADGTVVVFRSVASDLVADDLNSASDVFASVYERTVPPPSGQDLLVTSVSNPPATVLPGGRFSVTDTVLNRGAEGMTAATTRYYFSQVQQKTGDSTLLIGPRKVGRLEAGASSEGSRMVTVPISTALATYYLLACADDLAQVTEINESNNCAVAATQVTVGRPDLVVTAVSDPPGNAAKGSSFGVTETVTNQGALGAVFSTTRYYVSLNGFWSPEDRMLMGIRRVPALDAGASFPAPQPVTVTIPRDMAAGTYFLLACADDTRRVTEDDETNNCRHSATRVVVP